MRLGEFPVHRIPQPTMKVNANVNVVFITEFNGPIQLLQHRLVNLIVVAVLYPKPIAAGQPIR
jgi:hypothetical protein